ncbi:MAG: hypothetical protein WA057_00140 [Candidatus Magasanikiibacteriota bacterium]
MKIITVIAVAIVFCIKTGYCQSSKDLDSLVVKFVNDFQLKAEYRIKKTFSIPVDSCESIHGNKVMTFYHPAVYHAEGYQPDKYFIDVTRWPDNSSCAVILFYDKIGFKFIQLNCLYKNNKVRSVSIWEIPEGSTFEYRYYFGRVGPFNRMKVWSEKHTVENNYSKESEEHLRLSDFMDRFKDFDNYN